MDGVDSPEAARDDEPGVMGRLPTTRPQHRSTRRSAAPPRASSPGAARTPPRRSSATTTGPPATPTPPSAPTDERPTTPAVPAPPKAPRSGWATPQSESASSAGQPPLVAIVDGAVRTGEQVVRGVLRRLPFR
ncbi:MAG: hypothetical protein ITG02_16235 [Patulibacter sp.]|nr:hypothetical protein [Patulibacter sp.]